MERCLACEAEGVAYCLGVVHFALQLQRKSKELTIAESGAPIPLGQPPASFPHALRSHEADLSHFTFHFSPLTSYLKLPSRNCS